MANSKRKCKHCKEYKPVTQGRISGLGFLCSIDCQTQYALQHVRKARSKQNKKELAEYREKTKRASDWKREAQAAFNAYIRARDYGKPCISCGNMPEQKLGGTMDAGHFRSRASCTSGQFHCLNVWSQCVRCNRHMSGNIVEYRKGLIERIGEERVAQLEYMNEVKRFDVEYYKRVKRIFNKRARLYEKLKNIN